MHLPPSFHTRTLLSFSLPALFSTMTTTTPPNPPTSPPSYPTRQYQPRHTSWPYGPSDFEREDESRDTDFYSSPRFVTHIDDNAISLLREYYSHNLPRSGRILDFCSSWISHFPPSLERTATATATATATKNGEPTTPTTTTTTAAGDERRLEVIGLGINAAELAANPILSALILQDLNTSPTLPPTLAPLDSSTCVVSIDYLKSPLPVLSSLLAVTKPRGTVHLVVSNRCFPTKAVARWLRVGEEEKLMMVGDYLWWAGWRDVEIVTVCDGRGGNAGAGGGGGWWGRMVMGVGGGTDPLWVVRGRKVAEGEGGAEV